MLAVTGGRERSLDEYARLFERAGMRLDEVVESGIVSVIQGSPRASAESSRTAPRGDAVVGGDALPDAR